MKQDVIELDGAIGGGQVLRSGLSLSIQRTASKGRST